MTSSPNRPRTAVFLLGAGGLAYPFLVYAALGRVPAGALVLVALALAAARIGLMRGTAAIRPLIPALGLVAAATASLALVDPRLAALSYPVLMNLGMAASFGLSLWRGPSLVQTFASLTEPDPSPEARAYMRKVTRIWFVFLLLNGGASALTVAAGNMAAWTLYNGLISYLLIGALFAAEFLVRQRVRRRAAAP